MKSIVLKFLSVFTFVLHPKLDKAIRYYIRDNYFSRLNQIKYIFSDYIAKKPYKVIDYSGEFQEEINYVVPFAYWHYLNGTLKKTISCKHTKELYFFSKNHEEKYNLRDARYAYDSYEIPNKTHSISKSYSKWHAVPFKEEYENKIFIFDKPILVIANKYNTEWNEPPLNFINIETLDVVINHLIDKYQIIYNRPSSSQIVDDNSEILDLNEKNWIRTKYPNIIIIDDLFDKYFDKVNSFNHLQLMVYANCDNFISVHGGAAALASYFGGTNIILSKGKENPIQGGGLEIIFNEFNTIFAELSKSNIVHVKNDKELINSVISLY